MKKGILLLFALYLMVSYAHALHGTPLERRCEELRLLRETVDLVEFIVD